VELNKKIHNNDKRHNNRRQDDGRRHHHQINHPNRRDHNSGRQLNSRRKGSEKRKHVGPLMPNIYFSLQATIILLILYIVFQFDFPTGVKYVSVAISIIFIAYFLIRRKEVLNRQLR
jgi:hypothetical protein